jgi:hypothetical protein
MFTNLTSGKTYKAVLEWDSTKSGSHAIDYITSFDRTETTAAPCVGVTCSPGTATLPIPLDSRVSTAGVTQLGSQVISAFGATFPASGAVVANTGNLCGTASCTISSNPSAYSFAGTYATSSQTGISVYFTAQGSTTVLAWGGHIASRIDWGAGKSAAMPGSGGGGSGGTWSGGGGVGLLGQGTSGAGSSGVVYNYKSKGGSGGTDGYTYSEVGSADNNCNKGGEYGGGGGGTYAICGGGGGLGWKNNIAVTPGQSITVVVGSRGLGNKVANGQAREYDGDGGSGAVRIIWAGTNCTTRVFPSTNTGNL